METAKKKNQPPAGRGANKGIVIEPSAKTQATTAKTGQVVPADNRPSPRAGQVFIEVPEGCSLGSLEHYLQEWNKADVSDVKASSPPCQATVSQKLSYVKIALVEVEKATNVSHLAPFFCFYLYATFPCTPSPRDSGRIEK